MMRANTKDRMRRDAQQALAAGSSSKAAQRAYDVLRLLDEVECLEQRLAKVATA
jgi:hypothetical protein